MRHLLEKPNWTALQQRTLLRHREIHIDCGAVAWSRFLDADETAYSWLKILKACGVDIPSYVKIESSLIEEDGLGQYADTVNRKMVMLDFEGLPMPSWRWELHMDSNIIEVLREFRHLGCELMEGRMRGIDPSGPEDFKRWNDAYHRACWGRACFPFRLAPIDCIMGLDDYRLNRPWCRETYIRAVELRDRRQAKKNGGNRILGRDKHLTKCQVHGWTNCFLIFSSEC